MSHEIETRNGVASMMYAGQVPWHGLGQKVEKEVTAAAAIKLAGLDWKLETQPIYLRGKNAIDNIPVIGNIIPRYHAVVRPEDNQIMGVVSHAYEIIQNSDCFDFMDSIIGEGQAVYHTAGSLFGGRILFLTVKLPKDAQVGPDKIEKYILLSSSHDGSQALTVKWTPVRVVCNNTLEMANDNCSQNVKIRHRKNYREKVEEAREVLELTNAYYDHMEKSFNKLLETSFNNAEMTKFSEAIFPVAPDTKGLSTQTKNKRNRLVELFQIGKGNSHKDVARTKWAAYNAVTEYVDHNVSFRIREGSSKNEARMNSVFFGGGRDLKKKAFDLLSIS